MLRLLMIAVAESSD